MTGSVLGNYLYEMRTSIKNRKFRLLRFINMYFYLEQSLSLLKYLLKVHVFFIQIYISSATFPISTFFFVRGHPFATSLENIRAGVTALGSGLSRRWKSATKICHHLHPRNAATMVIKYKAFKMRDSESHILLLN